MTVVTAPGGILLNSNDYLALATDPRILAAMTASPATTGDDAQLRLEAALAEHVGSSAGFLCQSGWDASTGLMRTIADEKTPVYLDVLARMSLWFGARAAKAPVVPFGHNDVHRLRRAISRSGPGVIAVNSLYSGNGCMCPLAALCDIAEETGCALVVDESHSLGAYGDAGSGLIAELGLTGRVQFVVASLSKAFAGRAGLVACSTAESAARRAVSGSPPPPRDVAGLTAALAVIRTDRWRRDRLRDLSCFLRAEIAALGFDVEGSRSHIIALPAGPDPGAAQIRDALESRGVFGSVFCPPATARQRAAYRFSVHAGLTDSQAEQVVRACREVRRLFRRG